MIGNDWKWYSFAPDTNSIFIFMHILLIFVPLSVPGRYDKLHKVEATAEKDPGKEDTRGKLLQRTLLK